MEPLGDYFERHPDRFAISLAGAALLLVGSLVQAVRAQSTCKRVGAILLALIGGAQVAGLLGVRPRERAQV
jgi:hypothetical protein